MKKFTLGMVAGVSSLALAVPLLAQMAGAASGSGTSSSPSWTPPVPTQACVQAMAGLDEAHLAAIDAMTAAHKTALQARKAALAAAATLTDDTQRQSAVQKAQTDFRTAMQSLQQSDAMKTAMAAVQTACGNADFGFKHGGMGMGMFDEGMMKGRSGMMGGTLATKLGITADELKTALASGKTIQQIAQEHGVTLPENFGRGMHRGWNVTGVTGSVSSN